VDGHALEIIPDLAGDVIRPTNSIMWIPSLRTVLASDLVFDGVHPWLGNSDEASRRAWREALGRIRALDPVEIVAGHKFDPEAANAIAQLDFMDRYLADFEELRASGLTEAALVEAMRARYARLTSLPLLVYGVRMLMRGR
jgi:hypothetical protein